MHQPTITVAKLKVMRTHYLKMVQSSSAIAVDRPNQESLLRAGNMRGKLELLNLLIREAEQNAKEPS